MALAGCPSGSAPVEEGAPEPAPTVRLLVVDDPQLAKAIQREWQASGRRGMQLAEQSARELAETKRIAADCVIYPAGMLGALVERQLIAPLPDSAATSPAFARGDLLPLVRLRECSWGEKLYAAPLGSPQLVLLYRKDVLARLNRAPPATWQEYGELARLIAAERTQLGEAADPQEQPLFPALEPLAPGWAGQMLLARAAPYARNPQQYSALFDYTTMQPLIDAPPFVKALEELAAVAALAPQDAMLEMDPVKLCGELLAGRTAMAIAWPTRPVAFEKPQRGGPLEIGCVELPGAMETFNFHAGRWEALDRPARAPLLGASGRLGSICAGARHTRAASDVLLWIAGVDKGAIIASQSPACAPYRASQLAAADAWIDPAFGPGVPAEYAQALSAAQHQPLWMFSPRLPGRDEYLAALDAAVRQAVRGEQSPQQALAQAAAKWREITQALGEEAQRKAYVRSLGLEP